MQFTIPVKNSAYIHLIFFIKSQNTTKCPQILKISNITTGNLPTVYIYYTMGKNKVFISLTAFFGLFFISQHPMAQNNPIPSSCPL
jgi:hypothetical protein